MVMYAFPRRAWERGTSEAEYQLLLTCDLRYIQDESYRELHAQVNEVKRMLDRQFYLKIRG